MAKLLMISANLTNDPYPVYPLGANLVVSALRREGHDAELLDLLIDGDDGLDAALAGFRPDYIGVSLRNVDNVNYNEHRSFIFPYKSMLDRIREHSSAPIILGGSAFTIFPVQFMEFLGADYGIVGPGEVSLPKLIHRLEHQDPPTDRILKGETGGFGENRDFLAREHRLTAFYRHKGGMLNLYTKRGCPHRCLYCSYPSLEGNRYLFREPEAVVDEIAYLINGHGADFLFFTDSVFNDDDHRYLLIIEEMARRGISIPWTCYMRPALFHRDEIELMRGTGLHAVEWGTDCASDHTLIGMGKSFNWELVRRANNLFAEYGIPGLHFIIFGGPGETRETVQEGIENLAGLNLSVVFGGMGIRVLPNTGIYELAKKMGLVRDENDLFHREVYYHSPDIDPRWLNDYLTEAFRERPNWVFPWAGVAERNQFLHDSGLRGPLWDLLLKTRKT
ncbi:MAG: lipid biosynthesis B12-binding/radical SAM protein [Patescibacteria group bacterium]